MSFQEKYLNQPIVGAIIINDNADDDFLGCNWYSDEYLVLIFFVFNLVNNWNNYVNYDFIIIIVA